MEAHSSPTWLARALCVDLATLHAIASCPDQYYREFEIVTASRKVRTIADPKSPLKQIQRGIVNVILQNAPMHPCVRGSIRGHSPYTNAQHHAGQSVVVRIDIKDFFPSVTNRMVYAIWRDVFCFGSRLASLLTKLTTLHGHLPQGTPTSSYLANLALRRADVTIADIARQYGLRYTRFVDDLVLSGDRAREVVSVVAREISRVGFICSRKKVVVAGPTKQRKVTGYTVDTVSVPGSERDKIRAAIRQVASRTLAGEPCLSDLRSIDGRIAHVARTNPGAAERLKKQLAQAVRVTKQPAVR